MIWLTVSFTYCWVGPTHGNVYTLSGKDIDIRLAGITKLYGVSDYMKTQRVFGVEALCRGWDRVGFFLDLPWLRPVCGQQYNPPETMR